MKILLAGEGANELGGRSGDKTYPGVLETLLKKVQPSGWEIAKVIPWKSIRHFRANSPGAKETRNVNALFRKAKKNGFDAVVFVRDRDGKEKREKDIEEAITLLEQNEEGGPGIIGGMAVEKIEAWILALSGKTKSEKILHPQKKFEDLGIEDKNTAQIVAVVEKADLESIPKDAKSLHVWLDRARSVLGTNQETLANPLDDLLI